MPPLEGVSEHIPIDSSYEHSVFDDTATYSSGRTIATSAHIFRRENGRTYHSYRDGEYWGPNDEKMRNHELITNHACLLTLHDRIYLAPIKDDPRNIIDIGTGTGLWAIDMADKFPNAKVIGTDLSPVMGVTPPENVSFEVDDVTSEWVYPADHFDFVHIRGLFGSIADWPALYAQIFKHLAPGAYIEQVEWSPWLHAVSPTGEPTPLDDEVLSRWAPNFVEAGRRAGKTFEIAETMADLIREAGFVDVVERKFKWPVGEWSRDPTLKAIGRYNILNWDEGIEGWAMAVHTRWLGWTYTQVQEWLKAVRIAMRNPARRVYHEVILVYARKPETA